MVGELGKIASQQTEVGEIPSDWEIDQIGKLIRLISGQHILNQDYNQDGKGVAYLTGPADFGSIFPQISKWTKKPKAIALEEDILITVKGDGVGKINLLNVEKVAISRQLMAIHSQTVNGLYLYQYLKGKYSYFQELSTGSTVPGLSRDDINRCVIPLPPTLTEQIAIATALTDADALIIQSEKLIAKKKAIKQGAIQELLKPKENWEEMSFKKLVERFIDYRGVTPKKLGMNWGEGNIPALSANNVKMGSIDFARECHFASNTLYKKWMRNGDCAKDDVLMTMEAPLGNVAFIPDNRKYILSQRTILIKAIDSVDKVFLRYLMMSDKFQKVILENASGSTAQGIQRKKLEAIQVVIPKDKKEQTRIAQILSDMDAEIEKLEQRLAKRKMLKQGMMQVLLIGKIRLV